MFTSAQKKIAAEMKNILSIHDFYYRDTEVKLPRLNIAILKSNLNDMMKQVEILVSSH
jgi:hypothetical protein